MAEQKTRGIVLVAAVSAAVMIAQQVGGKATRDALFLDAFTARELPKVMLASSVLSVAGVLLMSALLSRFAPARVVPALFMLSAGGYVGEWFLFKTLPAAASLIIYLHVAILGSLLVSGFWSVVTERLDPHTVKKSIGRIAAGATSGGLLGGLLAERVASMLNSRAMLLFLATMCFVCALGVLRVGGRAVSEKTAPVSPLAGFKAIGETPYLRMLGLLVLLTAFAGGALDYVFKAEADATFDSSERLMSFFAIFYTVTSLVTIFVQTLLSKRALGRLGIGGTIALLPAAVLLSSAVGAAITRLFTLVIARGAEAVMYNSLYRSGYEQLFTPLGFDKRRPTKTAIDVGFDRIGTALAGGSVLVVIAVAAQFTNQAVLALVIVATIASLVVALKLQNGYVAELANSLKTGRIKLAADDIVDATTRKTLAETTMAIDRERLLREIDELRSSQSEGRGSPMSKALVDQLRKARKNLPAPHPGAVTLPDDDNADAQLARDQAVRVHSPLADLHEAIDDLLSGMPARMRKVLRPPLDPRLVSLVIPLLSHADHARAARRALRSAAPRIVGQLVDAMLDTEGDATVRRRIPDVIKVVRNGRGVRSLIAGLAAERFDVRERSGMALEALVRERPELAPAARPLLAAVEADLARDEPARLGHLFRVLGLLYDVESFELALRALRSGDQRLRGTSLEYLENVLPDKTRELLWPHIEAEIDGGVKRVGDAPRSTKELTEDLRRSFDGIKIDPALLKKPESGDA